MRGERGLSPVIGVILMILLAITFAHILGMLPVTKPSKTPYIAFDTYCNGSSIVIYHNGGEKVSGSELEIVLNDHRMPFPDIVFEPGDSVVISQNVVNGKNTLSVVHIPSQTLIFQEILVCGGASVTTTTTKTIATTTTTPGGGGIPGFDTILAVVAIVFSAMVLRSRKS